jgi:hypothetical protein
MRLRWIGIGVVLMLAALVVLNWQSLVLTAAILTAERRPALLSDAEEGIPGSARKFAAQFKRGTSEASLLDWLNENRFTIDRAADRANRLVKSLPCNEALEIQWSRTPAGVIESASAQVHEAGCL